MMNEQTIQVGQLRVTRYGSVKNVGQKLVVRASSGERLAKGVVTPDGRIVIRQGNVDDELVATIRQSFAKVDEARLQGRPRIVRTAGRMGAKAAAELEAVTGPTETETAGPDLG